jgi:mono/diheme cytochrome c family protein
MKRHYLLVGALLFLLLLTSAVLSPKNPMIYKSDTDSTSVETDSTSVSIPENVHLIFKNSCMGCHATDGKKLAMTKLDFSKWDQYKPKKQAKKATAICEMVTKGSMPPKSFRESHPDKVPTAAQIEEICKWSGTLTKQ